MKLIFTGKDGSMGLKRGKSYICTIQAHPNSNYIWLNTFANGEILRCPYSSFKALFENWMEV